MGAHYGAGSRETRPRARTGPRPVLVPAERPRFLVVRPRPPRPPRPWARQIRELMNEEQGQARSQSGDTGHPLTPLYCWGPHRGRAGQLAPGPEPVCTVSAPPACVQGWRLWEAVGKRPPGPCPGLREAEGAQPQAEVTSGWVLPVADGPVGKRKQCGASWKPFWQRSTQHSAISAPGPKLGDSHEGWGQEEAGEKGQRL